MLKNDKLPVPVIISKTIVLYNLRKFVPKDLNLSKSIYFALVNSVMSYAISVWGSGGTINALKPLHIAQKKCIRILFNIPNVSKYCKGNTKPTCINNNILTVHNLYVYATMNETYKLLGTNTPISVRKDLTISRLSKNRLITPTGNNITALSNNYYTFTKFLTYGTHFLAIKILSIQVIRSQLQLTSSGISKGENIPSKQAKARK